MVPAKRTSFFLSMLAALLLGGAATAWGTILVDTVGTSGTSSASPGDPVQATSNVDHSKEENSNCANGDGTRGCDYSLGVVNPAKTDNSTGSGGGSDTCHYETKQSYQADPSTSDGPQFDTVDDNVDHTVVSGGTETDIDGDGTLHSTDDGGDSMMSGDTLMCFYSSSSDASANHLNNANDGPATATTPTSFTVN